MKGKINVRVKSISNIVLRRTLAHNYRLRKDLNNVDYSKINEDYHSHTVDAAKQILARYQLEHRDLYKETFKERLRVERVNSFLEGVVTFPKKYQAYYEEGRITKKQLLAYFEIFKTKYQEESNTQILFSHWHFTETTFHCHFVATNFELKEGRTFKKRGWKSYLQDIAGFAYSPIGLERGTPKQFTQHKHIKRDKHYEQILEQSQELERILNDGIGIDDIEKLIKLTVTPLKTMLTYVKRALVMEKELSYRLKQEERALNKFREVFPNVSNVNDLNTLLEHIAENQAKQEYRKLKLEPEL